MADFRKWLIAFAALALLLSLGNTASAQAVNPTPFACTASAASPPTVRAEGITELVGDVVLNCTGGSPTLVGTQIPQSNVTIFLNTNVTSRLVAGSSTTSEALLTIDEPFPTAPVPSSATPGPGVPVGQSGCLTNQVSSSNPSFGNCQMYGVATTTGTNSLTGAPLATTPPTGNNGPYRGASYPSGSVTSNSYNIFQGVQLGPNSITWNGVPIDAPGSNGLRVIRITNVRANACQLGVSSTLIPSQIIMVISIAGSQAISLNNPTQTVALVLPGLNVPTVTPVSFLQCNTTNGALLGLTGGVTAAPITLTAREGFGNAFKVRNYAQVANAVTSSGGVTTIPSSGAIGTPNGPQNVLGSLFYIDTESGIILPSGTPGTLVGTGTTPGSIGVADSGTQITFQFATLGSGVSLFVPPAIPLVQQGTNIQTGLAVLVSGTSGSAGGLSGITISGTTGAITYEVVYSDPSVLEQMSVPVTVAFAANTSSNLPGSGTSTNAVNFAPLSTVTTASATAPIPRFCQPRTPGNIFSISLCTCNLLFPFVTNQVGFDTGIAIANTSLDPFGTTTQSGTITLFFSGNTTGGGVAPAPITTPSIAAGAEYVTNLSTIAPGFQGYMISTARFQFCHGFAFISDIGATKLAEGYLAIQLDVPGLNRTGVFGENEAH